MKKRMKRIYTELGRLRTGRQGTGWAAKQAARRANRGSRLSARTLRRRQRNSGQTGS